MSFFNKLFGSKDPLDQLRRAVQQKRWADALIFGESFSTRQLPVAALDELKALLDTAGDALAQMNLDEAEACQRCGDPDRAAEHFALARQQARSTQLQQKLAATKMGAEQQTVQEEPSLSGDHNCHSSCSSGCAPSAGAAPAPSALKDLDAHTRWELMLATYPAELADRFAASNENFQQAVLAAHEGDDQSALKFFEQISPAERDDLFYFERGALHAYSGETPSARRDFAKAIELNPKLLLALDALITLEMENGWEKEAEQRLQQLLAAGDAPILCFERMALLHYRKGDIPAATSLGKQALALGSREPQTILLTARLLEAAGNLNAAEGILGRLEGGGCGGGGPVALAEFWLRHNRNLDKALESFKAAFRQEGDNPRWALRIGQVYLAKGWKKEGLPLLRAALNDPKLGSELQQECAADLERAAAS